MDLLFEKYISHFESLCKIKCNIFDTQLKEFKNPDIYCETCENKCKYVNTHLYGCYEAQRWDNKYIYYCPRGFIFIAISIINDSDIIEYGIISGPIIMTPEGEPFAREDLPRCSTKNVNDISELMSAVFGKISDLKNKQELATTDVILNDIYKVINDTHINGDYPIALEKELQTAISDGNKLLSKELLNKILGHIFFATNNDFETLKNSVSELIILLSRSAIDGGADINQIFILKDNYIKEIKNFTNLERLSMWLTSVINKFIGYVFEFNEVKHTDIIYKVTGYIKSNYKEKITLEDLANYVYLSKSYLSKIFKEEMKCNLTAYTNQIRIEKAKPLLLDQNLTLVDIANGVGFDDQSYFTKVFKSIVGISPGKFREKHGKIAP